MTKGVLVLVVHGRVGDLGCEMDYANRAAYG